jgi:hypothetical protein
MIQLIARGGAVWSARVAHNHKVVGSNPTPATIEKARVQMDWGFFFLGLYRSTRRGITASSKNSKMKKDLRDNRISS